MIAAYVAAFGDGFFIAKSEGKDWFYIVLAVWWGLIAIISAIQAAATRLQ